jgi:hypothetical protein
MYFEHVNLHAAFVFAYTSLGLGRDWAGRFKGEATMIIVWGSGLYGNVDAVPGIGQVKTNFGHLYYIPLIPTGSHFIFEESSSGWRGVPIGLSIKSIFTAWLRVVLGFLAIASLIVGIIEIADKRLAGGIGGCVAGAVFIAMFVATKKMAFFSQASYDRAKTLAEQSGLSDEAMILIDLSYGEITEEEANRRLSELRDHE